MKLVEKLHSVWGSRTFLSNLSKGKLLMSLTAVGIMGGFFVLNVVATDTFDVTSPMGENIFWSGTRDITWNAHSHCVEGDTVSIALISESGSADLASGISCVGGTYSWNTDTTASGDDNYKIRIVKNGSASFAPESDFFTIDNTAPTITASTLTSPNGGELWGGDSRTIEWDEESIGDDNLGNNPISLFYSTDGGMTWSSIISGLENSGSYSWALPSVNSKAVKVKITATDLAGNESSDESDAVFEIDKTAPAVTVMSLNGGEKLQGGSSVALTWTATDDSGVNSTTLEYYDGSAWKSITLNDDNEWIVPSISINNAKIKVSATDGAGNVGVDESNADFMIDSSAPSVVVAMDSGFYGPNTFTSGTIKGTASDNANGSGVAQITLTVLKSYGSVVEYWNGSNWQDNSAAVTAIGTTNWTYDIASDQLTDGATYTITSSVVDIVGNGDNGTQDSFIYDSSAPVFTANSASLTWTSSDAITFSVDYAVSGAGSDHKYIFTNSATCDVTTNFTGATEFTAAGQTITVNDENQNGKYLCLKADDQAGNIAYRNVGPFKIDTKVASIVVSDDVAGTFQTSDTIKFDVDYSTSGAGKTEYVLTDGSCSVVNFSGVTATPYASGTDLTFNTEADNGKFVCLRARDGKGEQGSGEAFTYQASGQLKIDTTSPTITIDLPSTITKETSVTVTGTYKETNIKEIKVND
ncbi:MAG: Ser-Thr-rich GPI-anchored membrane family protein, partial [Candidatus Paceibacterota bacterium]